MKRMVIIGVVFVLVLSVVGVFLGRYVHNKRSLVTYSVTIPAGSVVTMFRDLGGDGPFSYDSTKPIKRLASSQKVTTKVGIYDFVIDNSSGKYADPTTQVIINSATSNVNINPALSDQELGKLSIDERPAIVSGFNKELSGFNKYYSIDKVVVFGSGEWAGVTMVPKSSQYDPARVVLSKTSGQWKVISKPAIMVVGSSNKSIPEKVVISTNKL